MKKVKILAGAAIFLVIILSGCSLKGFASKNPFSSVKQASSGAVLNPNVHTGTEGLAVSFVKESLPSKVSEGGSFNLAIKFENKGAHDIIKGYYKLFSIDTALKFESLTEGIGNINLNGKSFSRPDGEIIINEFRVDSVGRTLNTKDYISKFKVYSCYKYRTEASVVVCINPSDSYTDIINGCKPGSVALSGGQGAPVVVTKVVPYINDGEFEVYIKNMRDSEIISDKSYASKCTGEPADPKSQNVVRFRAKLSNAQMDCGDEGVTLLPKEEKMILCTTDVEEKDAAYTTPLLVEMEYGVVDTLNGEVSINVRDERG